MTTMYSFCGRTREHPQHQFHRAGAWRPCPGTLLYSDMPFEEQALGALDAKPQPREFTYCGSRMEHQAHVGHWYGEYDEPASKYLCSGKVLCSASAIGRAGIEWEPPSEQHQSPKGALWDQFLLFDPDQVPKENRERAQELAQWWMDRALVECRNLIPKAISYGSVDLDIMGDALVKLTGVVADGVPPQELALTFYALGKVSRILGALEQGVRPSEDSWADLAIYAKMAIRVREVGHW